MNFCNYCGVELDANMTRCPLCGLAAGETRTLNPDRKSNQPDFNDKALNEIESMTAAQKRKLFWEISGIMLISGIIVTLIINIILSKNITWSKYVLVASTMLFINISFFTIFRNRAFLLVVGTLISNAFLLLLLDLINLNSGWGIKLGIPLLVSLYVLIIIAVLLIRNAHQRGFNVLAILIIAIGMFLICTEVFISLYFKNRITLSWSVIAGSSMIPISALLFFVHYRLRKGMRLRRFFNI